MLDATRVWWSNTYNLKLDALSVDLDRANLEVDANSGNERRRPSVVTESEKKTGLSYACTMLTHQDLRLTYLSRQLKEA